MVKLLQLRSVDEVVTVGTEMGVFVMTFLTGASADEMGIVAEAASGVSMATSLSGASIEEDEVVGIATDLAVSAVPIAILLTGASTEEPEADIL